MKKIQRSLYLHDYLKCASNPSVSAFNSKEFYIVLTATQPVLAQITMLVKKPLFILQLLYYERNYYYSFGPTDSKHQIRICTTKEKLVGFS